MGYYIFLFIIPIIAWIGIAKAYFKHEFTLMEMGGQAIVSIIVIAGLFVAGSHLQTSDTMLVNGVVTELNPTKKNCKIGWSDYQDSFCTEYRTRTVRDGQTCSTVNGKRTCTPKYKTQYNYIYSWEQRYFVKTDIAQTHEIKREDRQGAVTPKRFAEINIGDPVTKSVSYTNYIRGASSSLFNEELPPDVLPPLSYPKVRDYYKANRVIFAGTETNSKFQQEWNEELAVVNSNIRKTGANVIIVVTGYDRSFSEKLAQAWEAHNINDIIVTVGVSGDVIDWVDVRSWSSSEMVNVTIRDELLNLGTLDNGKINSIIEDAVSESYNLRDMSEFEYLADDIPPPTWVLVLAFFILLVVSPGVTFLLSTNQIKS